MDKKKLEALGLTEEQITAVFAENGKDIKKEQDKLIPIETERDNYKTQYETARDGLKAFEGVDIETLKKERDTLSITLATKEKEHKEELDNIAYDKKLSKQLEGKKFSSNSAKSEFLRQVKEKKLQAEGDTILGFEDYLTEYAKADPGAFVVEDTTPQRLLDLPPTGGTPTEKETIMAAAQKAMGIKTSETK